MKQTLLNPGPVNVTERVRRALLGPDICHREEEFYSLLKDTRERLLKIFGISKSHTAIFFSGSGTSALEAILSSYAATGRTALVLSNGVYGERVEKILKIHGAPTLTLARPIGKFPNLSDIEAVLKKFPKIGAVAMVHHETSSGMLNPLRAVGKLAKKYRKTFIVDAISSLGAEAIDFSVVDFLAGTSGKCLHGFPGVSFAIVSKKTLISFENQKPKTFSLSLCEAWHSQKNNETSFTPAVQIFYAFCEALKELENEGLHRRRKNYALRSALIQRSLRALGVKSIIDPACQSHVLNAFWLPKGLSYKTLHDTLKKKGFTIYAGQARLKNKIFRVANLGDISMNDLRRFVQCFRKIIKK